MNREIKFRAWDKWNNKFVYFSLDKSTDYDRDCIGIFANVEKQQYTGLKDKNGKEIYEGDIVHATSDYKDPNWNWVITWNEGSMEPFGYYYDEPENDWEVIGNIYENPDLLSNQN